LVSSVADSNTCCPTGKDVSAGGSDELTGLEEERDQQTILLVDSDLGFAFWLGQALNRAGYEAVPATTPDAGAELIQEHRISVDILVIDPASPDALPFVSRLRQSRRGLKVIAAVPEESAQPPPMPDFDAIMRKPKRLTVEAALEWVSLIQRLSPAAGTGGGGSR
jgi:CheY-like chemotaxis protein